MQDAHAQCVRGRDGHVRRTPPYGASYVCVCVGVCVCACVYVLDLKPGFCTCCPTRQVTAHCPFQIVIEDCVKVLHESIEAGNLFDYVINDLTEFPVEKAVKGASSTRV